MEENVSKKNRLTTLMLCWFLGFLGVHRLYAGKLGSGFLMAYGTLCTALVLAINVPIGLMCLITMGAFVVNDFVVIAFGQFSDCYGKCICSDKIN
jgi:TM2 domain-containing membrane protein YozV